MISLFDQAIEELTGGRIVRLTPWRVFADQALSLFSILPRRVWRVSRYSLPFMRTGPRSLASKANEGSWGKVTKKKLDLLEKNS